MEVIQMSKLILYHGSPEIIKTPMFGKGKSYNDYGKGFYCTEHLELAKEWACTENTDGYANKYEMDTTGLSVLNLSSDEYTILHWLALLMNYRKFRISTPIMKRGAFRTGIRSAVYLYRYAPRQSDHRCAGL